MAIHVKTPTADYGISSTSFSGLGSNTSSFATTAVGGINYNILGENTAAVGATAAASCYVGPSQVFIDATAGTANLLLSRQAGLPAHTGTTKVVSVSVRGGNAVTVEDANGVGIGPNGGTTNVLNNQSAVFIWNGTAWEGANGL